MTIPHNALPSFSWIFLAAAVDTVSDHDPLLDTRSARSEAREREAARAYRLARRVRLAARHGELLIPCPDGDVPADGEPVPTTLDWEPGATWSYLPTLAGRSDLDHCARWAWSGWEIECAGWPASIRPVATLAYSGRSYSGR